MLHSTSCQQNLAASFARAGFIAMIFLLSLPASGNSPREARSDYFQRSWSTDEGLPENSVTAVVQT